MKTPLDTPKLIYDVQFILEGVFLVMKCCNLPFVVPTSTQPASSTSASVSDFLLRAEMTFNKPPREASYWIVYGYILLVVCFVNHSLFLLILYYYWEYHMFLVFSDCSDGYGWCRVSDQFVLILHYPFHSYGREASIVLGDTMYSTVKTRLTGNQSKGGWCHFSLAIMMCNIYLL